MTESVSYSFNVTAFIDLILIDNSKVIKYALNNISGLDNISFN